MRQAITAIAVAAVMFTATCGGHQRNAARDTALMPNTPALPKTAAKLASIIPAGVRLVARDAGIALSAGGYTLSWKYENPGDYGQDGIVGLEDIAPLTEHWGEAATAQNEWIDGSGDGVIGVADITPIAMNWGGEVNGYRIEGAPSANGPWNEVVSLTLDEGDDTGGRLAFAQEIAPSWTYYRVVTITPDGDAAFSNTLIAPSNEPIIYGVSPISGYQREEYTFTATASGQAPLTYAWDFGGGASPNTSSDISPIVTLAGAGEYSGSLTISNSYGPTTFPFTLSVSARDTWAHTWGSNGSDRADDMAIDAEGNIYLTGWTSFGAGYEDVLILKYSPEGEVLWARAWGTSEIETGKGICISPEGNAIVGGNTRVSGKKEEVVILEFSPNGDLLRSAVWGTEENESCVGMAQDEAGNLYITGRYYVTWGDESILLLKLDSDWNVVWARKWGSEIRTERANTLDYAGGILALGGTVDMGDSDDALILKLNVDGNVHWAKTWKLDMDEVFYSVTILPDGRIIAAGGSGIYSDHVSDGILASYYADGTFLEGVRTYTENSWSVINGICDISMNKFCVVGYTGWDSFVLTLNPDDLGVESDMRWRSSSYGSGLNCVAEDAQGNIFSSGSCSMLIENGSRAQGTGGTSLAGGESSVYDAASSEVTGAFAVVEGVVTRPEGIVDRDSGDDDDVFIIKNLQLPS